MPWDPYIVLKVLYVTDPSNMSFMVVQDVIPHSLNLIRLFYAITLIHIPIPISRLERLIVSVQKIVMLIIPIYRARIPWKYLLWWYNISLTLIDVEKLHLRPKEHVSSQSFSRKQHPFIGFKISLWCMHTRLKAKGLFEMSFTVIWVVVHDPWTL